MVIQILICLFVGYLCGTFSTGYLMGKRKQVDIREYGSGNAGTTNAFRTLGKKAGILTFLGDFLKAVIPIIVFRFLIFPEVPYRELLVLITGFAVVLGHNYPFWLHFKGGKGIAVTAGALVAYDPLIVPIGLVLFAGIVFVTKYVSLGSLLIAVLVPIWIAIRTIGDPYYWPMVLVGSFYTISAVYKHRSNIKRLLQGTENKIGQRVKIKEQEEQH